LAIERLLAAAKERPRLGLGLLALLFAVQISPWLYPSVDGCLYLKTVSDFLSAPRLDDFCCLVPPGYPLLIAPAFVFGDRPFLAVSMLNWLLAVAMIGGVYLWARRLAPSAALALTTAVGVNISLWIFYRRPTKEIATLALLMWTVNAMHSLLDERRMARVMGLTAVVALLTTYLVLIRYAGIMLVLAFAAAAALLVRRGDLRPARAVGMSLVIGLVSTSALLLWLVYDRSHGTGGTYVDSIVSIYHDRSVSEPRAHDGDGLDGEVQEVEVRKPRHFTRALLYRVNDLTCLTVPGLWKSSSGAGELLSLSTSAGTLVLAVLALGWWRIVSTRIDVLALMLPIYLLLYAHWDSSQPGGRFLLPVLPIIFACVGVGLIAIVRSAAAPAAGKSRYLLCICWLIWGRQPVIGCSSTPRVRRSASAICQSSIGSRTGFNSKPAGSHSPRRSSRVATVCGSIWIGSGCGFSSTRPSATSNGSSRRWAVIRSPGSPSSASTDRFSSCAASRINRLPPSESARIATRPAIASNLCRGDFYCVAPPPANTRIANRSESGR
jgi:hypothetical protein